MPDNSSEFVKMNSAALSNELETPLEAAARQETAGGSLSGQNRREEQEADRVIADVDDYVTRTDPASRPVAERELDAWEIPSDPLAGIPDDVAIDPEGHAPPLVSVFEASSETEANIVRGVLEAAGIPVTFDGAPAPILGSILETGSARWGGLLVPASEADAARTEIESALESGRDLSADDLP